MANTEGCKVDRTIDRFDLQPPGKEYPSLDEYLVANWTGEAGGESTGYKELTRWFNRRLLKRVYERAGRSTIGTRLDSEYEALTGDDDLLRAEVVDDLKADGIDTEQLLDGMVSWSTMRRHLKNCLNAEKERREASEWEVDSVDIARNQLESKTADALRSLESKDRLPEATRADIDVQVKLSCPECPTRVPLQDALNRGYVCESHFEEPESAEKVQVSDKLGLALPAGISSLFSKGSTYSYEFSELVGSDLSMIALELGTSLGL